MNLLFYFSAWYFIPVIGFIVGALSVLVGLIVEYYLYYSRGKFVKVHVKLARILLGPDTVFYNEKDSVVILHGYHFRKVLGYLCISECMVAGTIFLITIANAVTVSKESCNILTSGATSCFRYNSSSGHWLNFEDSLTCSVAKSPADLICFNIAFNFGAGIAVLGSLLYLIPLVYSNITAFIVHNSGQDMFPGFTAIVQALVIVMQLVIITGFSLGLAKKFINPTNFIQILFLLLFIIFAFAMPWCCMERNEEMVYLGNAKDLEASGDFVNVPVQGERAPLTRGNGSHGARRHYHSRK